MRLFEVYVGISNKAIFLLSPVSWLRTGYLATEQCGRNGGGSVGKGVSIASASRLYKEDTAVNRHSDSDSD
jgi:hypothetical protein